MPKEALMDDIDAQMRRHHTVWMTDYGVYFRPANNEHNDVRRFKWPDMSHKDVFKKEVHPLVQKYKNGSHDLRPNERKRWNIQRWCRHERKVKRFRTR